ncbi:MAG: hypothetical protein IJT37_05735 [Lachnospiraceae bacterium]|nr:hypothetical protein [Lachnospiraceae bacterium]
MKILRFLLKIIVFIIQLPLTVIYFAVAGLGALLSGAGCILGFLTLVLALIFLIFGEFSSTGQAVAMFAAAIGLMIIPEHLTALLGEGILGIKGFLRELAG